MTHIEVRYWDGDQRRIDVFPDGSKKAGKRYKALTEQGIPAQMATVRGNGFDLLAKFAEIKRGTVA